MRKRRLFLMAIMALILYQPDAIGSCGTCSDNIATKGWYRNISFGFSVIIPSGLTGRWNSIPCVDGEKGDCICMADHGRFISLADNNYINIDAEHIIEPDEPLANFVLKNIDYLKNEIDNNSLVLTDVQKTKLYKNKAIYFKAEYERNGNSRVTEYLIGYNNNMSNIFTIRFDSDKDSFNKYHKYFMSIIKSWRPQKLL
jgi:hypothetical protein